MRKIFALAMVAILALTVAFAAMGCGGKKAEETTTTTTTEQPMSSAPMDSTMHMGSDTTTAK